MRWESAYHVTAAALRADDPDDELCCEFARLMTANAFGAAVTSKVPHALWNLWPETGDPWGPVTACFHSGVAVPGSRKDSSGKACADGTPARLDAHRFHRFQGWRGTPFAPKVTGHTITVLGLPNGLAVVYDSAKDPRGARATRVVWADYCKQYVGGMAGCVLKEA